ELSGTRTYLASLAESHVTSHDPRKPGRRQSRLRRQVDLNTAIVEDLGFTHRLLLTHRLGAFDQISVGKKPKLALFRSNCPALTDARRGRVCLPVRGGLTCNRLSASAVQNAREQSQAT